MIFFILHSVQKSYHNLKFAIYGYQEMEIRQNKKDVEKWKRSHWKWLFTIKYELIPKMSKRIPKRNINFHGFLSYIFRSDESNNQRFQHQNSCKTTSIKNQLSLEMITASISFYVKFILWTFWYKSLNDKYGLKQFLSDSILSKKLYVYLVI